MRKNVFRVAVSVIAVVSVGVISFQNRQEDTKLSDWAMANIEALATDEIKKKCPDPYDVYDHQLSFSQRTADCTVEADGEINLMGQKIRIGGVKVHSSVEVVYEIGDCDKYSPGNCCPNNRNGEIRIISYSESLL